MSSMDDIGYMYIPSGCKSGNIGTLSGRNITHFDDEVGLVVVAKVRYFDTKLMGIKRGARRLIPEFLIITGNEEE